MKKIGLALSGGGFRATLFHLGLIRFLRDAGLLTQVTHITSVSGGSIMAAHLVLNWSRYTGSESDFDEAAKELLTFTQLDIRNRILRRFPLAMLLAIVRRFFSKSNRKLTRAGLLEDHYQKLLYGDVSLFELPKTPKLHVLSTNLSEGCLCSFYRDGLLMGRRGEDQRFHLAHIHTGLATVPMAVAASSAFPGFFPPLELSSREVGVTGGEFGKQSYTDGGVYDNLGVRMFRFLDRQILIDDQLSRDDFLDLKSTFDALRKAAISPEQTALRRLAEVLEQAEKSQEDTPLRRLAIVLEEAIRNPALLEAASAAPKDASATGAQPSNCVDQLLARLWEVMCHYQFQHEPLFSGLKPLDPAAAEFLKESYVGACNLDMGSQFWLNRHLLEVAFREATGQGCFRRLNTALDGVIVSDVGRQIQVVKDHGGGLIRSAIRASDILMDRVWQLENETFKASSEFVFARVSDVVSPEEDPTALHPEIQRQLTGIRTDLDQFSALEISSLVRHGYCVGRRICRARPDLFGSDLPLGAPWEPLPEEKTAERPAQPAMAGRERTSTTIEARQLQASSNRRVWSRFFDWRDWVSYVYVPIIVPLLLCLPYIGIHYYQRMVRLNHLTLSYAQGSPDVTELDRMLEEDGPPPKWKGVPVEEGHGIADFDLSGFKVLCDSRITDLRSWTPPVGDKANPDSRVYVHRRLSVLKKPDTKGPALFHVRLILLGPEGEVRFPVGQQLQGRVVKSALGGNTFYWDAIFDLTKTPSGTPVDLVMDLLAPGAFLKSANAATGMSFAIDAETAELAQWVLMPKRRVYKNFRYVYFRKGQPETSEEGSFYTQYLAKDHSILAFKILAMDPGYEHEIFWNYQ